MHALARCLMLVVACCCYASCCYVRMIYDFIYVRLLLLANGKREANEIVAHLESENRCEESLKTRNS